MYRNSISLNTVLRAFLILLFAVAGEFLISNRFRRPDRTPQDIEMEEEAKAA